jgi:hypothetical protein
MIAEIEKQFARLDAAVAALKAACEGRLVPTEAELAEGPKHTAESKSILQTKLPKR